MNLQNFFLENPKAALAFSGGTDSAFLMYTAIKFGADVKAYYVKTPFQPQFELEDAIKFSKELHAQFEILEHNVLLNPSISSNPGNRCYFCKREIFSVIAEAASLDGYPVLIDGTNASDDETDRPGMLALKEFGVRSPLREAGLTKSEIRSLSREAGLFTWDKPAYACLATRIPLDEPITRDKLKLVENAENYLWRLGFRDFRVRMIGTAAKIQVKADQMRKAAALSNEMTAVLKKEFSDVLLDLEARNAQ